MAGRGLKARILSLKQQSPALKNQQISKLSGAAKNYVRKVLHNARLAGAEIPKERNRQLKPPATRLETLFAKVAKIRHYNPGDSITQIARKAGTITARVAEIVNDAAARGYSVVPFSKHSRTRLKHLDGTETDFARVLSLRWKRPDQTSKMLAKELGLSESSVRNALRKAKMKGYPLPDLNAEIKKLNTLKKDLEGKRGRFPSKEKGIRNLIDAIDDRLERLEKKKKSERRKRIVGLTQDALNERGEKQ